MKLIWFGHFLPFPPKGGAHQRSYNLLVQMSRRHRIVLVAFNFHRERKEQLDSHLNELKKYCESVEIWDLPLEWRSAHWWGRLTLSPLLRIPFSCRAFWSSSLAQRWQQILSQHPGALVHFDSPDLAMFRFPAAGSRKVLNHHNCESAITERRAQLESNPLKKLYLQMQALKLAELERQICHKFEANIVVSEVDGQLLRDRNPRAHIHVVENGTDVSYFQPSPIPSQGKTLIFASSMNWYPNLSAIQFFVREIWPTIRLKCPEARLFLAGQAPPPWLVQWVRNQPGITLVADPIDMRPLIAMATAFICPIIQGGGTRLKILDAMAMGKAVVSTTIGCEGLQVKHGDNILLADAPQGFATQVVRVLEEVELRNRLGEKGRVLVENHYCWERIANQLELAYRCALQGNTCTGQLDTVQEVGART